MDWDIELEQVHMCADLFLREGWLGVKLSIEGLKISLQQTRFNAQFAQERPETHRNLQMALPDPRSLHTLYAFYARFSVSWKSRRESSVSRSILTKMRLRGEVMA